MRFCCGAAWRAGLISLGLLVPQRAQARDAGVPEPRVTNVAAPSEPRVAQIRQLLAGTLDPRIPPESLFDVPLTDDVAIDVEAARLRALLRAVAGGPGGDPPAVATSSPSGGEVLGSSPGTINSGPAASASAQGGSVGDVSSKQLWDARVELDRARLAFYELPPAQRAELLLTHERRQEAARSLETDEERRAREAEAERQRVLEAARIARTEAERLVAEELARLIAVESRVRETSERLEHERETFVSRKDTVLGWQRRVRDVKGADREAADRTYDALRRQLATSRRDLSEALDALYDENTEVPAIGPNPLLDVPPEVPTDAARQRRAAVEQAMREALAREAKFREERAAILLDEVTTLNRERLGLLGYLSEAKRDAVTGLTAEGWDQARAETFHLSLILRYHQHVAGTWLAGLRQGGAGVVSPWKVLAVSLPLLFAVVGFLWARRRSQVWLRWADVKLAEADRVEGRSSPSLLRRFVRGLLKTHRPIEGLLFVALVFALLPSGAAELLEVQLLVVIATWILAGALVVNIVNAVAAGGAEGLVPLEEEDATGALRLRSLRLVGRTVVAFSLVLVLSARLVGEGTIYSWVWSTCWFAALPLFLLLVRWWQGVVFERLERLRKKTPFQSWVLAHRDGWKSSVAVTLGALHLFATGAVKLSTRWISGFDVARRVHAYLFKREIERIGEGKVALSPLPPELHAALHPELPFETWIDCPASDVLGVVRKRAAVGRGGIVGVCGARGMGKSSVLRALLAEFGERARLVTCEAHTSLSRLQAELTTAGARSAAPRLLLLDDASTLIRPNIGGLSQFDALIAMARNQTDVLWVVTVAASVWPLLKRARDARPLFDETCVLRPWNEGQIGALLAVRCQNAGVTPHFDGLLDKLPPGADELDRQDALRAKRAGYERMLWDHVRGNPALALEVWRASLAMDEAGVVHVRPLHVPDTTCLERLPDASLFILRAVLQLAPATVETVASATRLRPEEVLLDFRFGTAQGFFEEYGGRVRVAWPWLRAVTLLLERRHLLVNV